MSENIKLSIIVPVYNVGKYVEKCLKSLCGLKIENEIIIINDGSTDNSLEIVKKFKENHIEENIKIINQENKGLSGARNRGIIEAKGEYVSFIDSDDFVDTRKYEVLVKEIIEKDLDFGIGNYVEYYDNVDKNQYFKTSDLTLNEDKKTGKELFSLLMDKKYYRSAVWIRIIKRKFIGEHKLFFKEKILCEDILYSFYLHYYAKKTMIFDINFYNYYRENEISIMNTKNIKKSIDILDSIAQILKEIKNLKEEKKFIISVVKFSYSEFNSAINEVSNIFEINKVLKIIRNILKENKKMMLEYDKNKYIKYLIKNVFTVKLKNILKINGYIIKYKIEKILIFVVSLKGKK